MIFESETDFGDSFSGIGEFSFDFRDQQTWQVSLLINYQAQGGTDFLDAGQKFQKTVKQE